MIHYTVLYDNTSTIVDYSLALKDFSDNTVALPLESTQYLYVGLYKKFKQFYIELNVKNDVANTLGIEYWNGTAWTALEHIDESEGFTKSGFIMFNRPNDWASNVVDSKQNFYIRIQPSINHNILTSAQGLGILLSNDRDLEGIKSNIVTKLNSGNSWIEKHEAARKFIIQRLRNNGYRKAVVEDPANNPLFEVKDGNERITYSNLTEFDLHEPFELREASKFYALSMIYLDELSDEQDDKWERAGLRHESRGAESLELFMLRIDTDDDGEEDIEENKGDTGINLSWV